MDRPRGDGRGDRAEIAWYQRFSGFWGNFIMCFMFPWTNVSRELFIRGVVLLRVNIQIRGNNRIFAYLYINLGITTLCVPDMFGGSPKLRP